MSTIKGIREFLFGSVPDIHGRGRADVYLKSVNVLYAETRRLLSARAHQARLNPKQTVAAKKIIHNLNKDTVEAMTGILGLDGQNMTPDDLIK